MTLNHPEMGRHLTLVPLPERLRVVLSEGEVAQLLEAAPGVKYKAAFSVAYGAVCVSMLRVANLASGAGIRNPSQKRALDERLIKTNWQIGNTPWAWADWPDGVETNSTFAAYWPLGGSLRQQAVHPVGANNCTQRSPVRPRSSPPPFCP